MDTSLSNKVTVITGASRGIGRQLVQSMAEAGARLVFCARSEAPIQSLASELQKAGHDALPVVADVSQERAAAEVIQAAIARHGRVDVLVNNVGIAGPTKSIEATSLDEWNDTLTVNLTSAFLCLREVVPHMRRQGGGSVVNIGSITGKKPLIYRVGYAAAKMGMIGMTRTAAEELGPDRIRVNCVCPGSVAGERLDEVLVAQAEKRGMTMEQIRAFAAGMSPLKAFTTAQDVAALVTFLASDASIHMTGQDINVSAGQVMY
ncbi:MAG TPA: SDR family NAD(P)-dependent oxidoreductase [Rubrivivax sp.]|nr:SDR family NAD(P)-dependent oxidoreductase [Rubrivivax sp.]